MDDSGTRGSGAASNKEIARRYLLAIAAQDAVTMRSVLAPEAHLSLMVAGVYSPQLRAFPRGTQWGREALIDIELDFQHELDGPFALQILSLIGEGELVAAEAIGKGFRAATGRSYIQHYSYHFRVSNGRIADIHQYQDTFHLWDVWSDAGTGAQPHYLAAGKLVGPGNEPTGDLMPDNSEGDPVAVSKASVRRFLAGVSGRDSQSTRAAWSPDGIWSFAVGGDYSPALRAFQGAPRWDREGMIDMQQNAQKSLREPMTLDIYSLIAEGDEISAEAVGFLVRSSGRAYRQHYSFHFRARGGKLAEGHVYQDTLHQYDVSLEQADVVPVAVPSPVDA
jgi:ketosteroid isomerase-like protein